MQAIVKLIIVFMLSTPCWATWTLVNTQHSHYPGGGSSHAFTVTSTAANDLLVVGICTENNTIDNAISSITDNKSDTWHICTNCDQGTGTGTGGGPCAGAYTLSSAAGVTTVTLNNSTTNSYNFEFREYNGNAPYTFDVSANVADAACTTCAGAALTLGASPLDVIVQEGSNTNSTDTISAISGSYGNLDAFCNSTCYGAAEWLNVTTTTPTTPNWTQVSSHSFGGFAMSFKETAAPAPIIHNRNPVESY